MIKATISFAASALILLSMASLDAAETEASSRALAAEVQPPFAKLADVIQLVAKGEVEEAWDRYAEALVDAPKEAGEFESEFRVGFRRLFKQFPKGTTSLDLVAVRRLSTSSYRLTSVANTRQGPVVVEAVTYRYDNKWWFCQIGYQPVHTMTAERMKEFFDVLPAERLATPTSIAISAEPVNKISSTAP